MNRRLVPMPPARPPAEPADAVYERLPPLPAPKEIAAQRRPRWDDDLAARIRSTPPWVLFLWLAATAVIYAYVGKLILFIVAIVLFIRVWVWLSWRFQMTDLRKFIYRSVARRQATQATVVMRRLPYIQGLAGARRCRGRGVDGGGQS